MYFSQLPQIMEGNILKLTEDKNIDYLVIDSRKAFIHPSSLFVALKGQRHDGHKYLKELYNKGIIQFLVEDKETIDISSFPNANIFQTPDTLKALQKIASFHRSEYNLEVIAITGSNGKTIVKEWLAQLLNNDFSIIKSPKSYNSQVGVPLSVWEINEKHDLGIFEAGISKPGEMESLEVITQPTMGLITNLGPAHDEGFDNREHKLIEKVRLFKNCKTIFYCQDHKIIHEYLSFDLNRKKELINWSKTIQSADLYVSLLEKEGSISRMNLHYKNQDFKLILPFTDEASIENVLHCILVMLFFKISPDEIQKRVGALRKVSMRLELKQGVNGCYIVDDSYNNDLAGLEIAINFLNQQNQKPHKILILSDLLESGVSEDELYKTIAALISQKGISKLIGIGPLISKYKDYFELDSKFFPDTHSFLQKLSTDDFHNEIILVKGARVFTFEKITKALQHKVHGTVLEINMDALANNLNFYRSRLAPSTKIMVMVKAFAYGSGSNQVANILQFHRVDYLAVAYPDEGVELRQNGVTLPIMVMNPTSESFDKMLQYKLEPEIYSPLILSELVSFLKNTEQACKIHIELETGMQRLGFEKNEFNELIALLKTTSNIEVVSVFSHLAGSDEAVHNDFTKEQIEKFKALAQLIEDQLGYKVIKHVLNSPGIIRFPDAQMDMVRLGIGLYGIEVNDQFQDKLIPISTLKTTISQIKHLKRGETVGYGRRGVASRATTIATIALGYADGFSRAFSRGKGKVLVNGHLASVIGNVCMDMTMIDITGIKAKEGDEVVIFGRDLPITEVAKWIDTIPYEILTNIKERVKRIYYME